LIHPHAESFKELTDNQLEQKLYKLNGMYFMTDNQDVRQQMILLMDSIKIELEERQIAAKKKQTQNDDNDLDNLINVS
jgi:hypothetical protein